MRRGFSLVEVMIATVIIALVGLSLLQMGTRHQKMDDYIEQKSDLASLLSIATLHHDAKFDKLTKSAYDYLENSYSIDHTEIKRMLQDTEFHYVRQELESIDFGEESMEEEEEDFSVERSRQSQRFYIYKGTIRHKETAATFFFLQQ